MDTTSPGFARGMFAPRTAVAARATGGRSTSLPAASGCGAVCLGLCRRRCWVGRWDEGPFGVCSVGLLIARPVSPLGYGMIYPHDASCTMSADVLCHNPPGPARGHGLLAQTHTSEPAISRGALPCAVRRAMLSLASARHSERQAAYELRICTAVLQSRTEPSGTSIARNCAKSSCQIWLWTRLMR
jgi:hypothetical protein